MQDLVSSEMPRNAPQDMLKSIRNINMFLSKYFESVKQVQLAQRNKLI